VAVADCSDDDEDVGSDHAPPDEEISQLQNLLSDISLDTPDAAATLKRLVKYFC
jgi:hypothetical protein